MSQNRIFRLSSPYLVSLILHIVFISFFYYFFLDQPQELEEVEKCQSSTRTPPSTPVRVEEGTFNQAVMLTYAWDSVCIFGVPQGIILRLLEFSV